MAHTQFLGYTWWKAEKQLQQIDLWSSYMHVHACASMHMYTYK